MNDLLLAVSRGSTMRLDSLGVPIILIKEYEIIQHGPTHKWWLSARLLLGLTQDQALLMHDIMKGSGIDYRCEWQWWRMMVDGQNGRN